MDETSFLGRRDDGPPTLLLAGRAWRVKLLDWKRRRAHVETAEEVGRSPWRGGGQLLGHDLCRAIGRVLADAAAAAGWSQWAVARMDSVRSEYSWLPGNGANVLLATGREAAWRTFAGCGAYAAPASSLAAGLDVKVTLDNFAVRFPPGLRVDAIGLALDDLQKSTPGKIVAPASERAIDGLRFSECLTPDMTARVVQVRLTDIWGVGATRARWP